jgi:hypothetical protein
MLQMSQMAQRQQKGGKGHMGFWESGISLESRGIGRMETALGDF